MHKFLVRIQPILDLFSEAGKPLFPKICAIRDFLLARPFLHFGKGYCFSDFESEAFPMKLLNFCDEFDMSDVANRICSAFEMDAKEFLRKRSRLLLILGLLDETKKGFGHLEVGQVPFLLRNSMFHTFALSQYLARLPGRGKQETLFIYQHIKLICFRKVTLEPMNDDLQKRMISETLSIKKSLKMHVILMRFDFAYSKVLEVKGSEKRIQLFIHSVWVPAISQRHNRKSLVKFFLEQDPLLSRTRILWTGLMEFASKHMLLHTLFAVHALRNSFEEAVLTALDIFDREESAPRQLAQVSHAQFTLSQAIHYRTTPDTNLAPPYRPSSSHGLENLEKLLKLTAFLQSIIEFCMEKQIVFKGEYNLIRRNGSVLFGAVLLLNGADALFTRLLELVKTPLVRITNAAGALLTELPLAALLKNLKEVVAKQDGAVGKDVASDTLRRIAIGTNRAIIVTCWSRPEDQCSFFLEYNYVMEAYLTAVPSQAKSLVPAIAARAAALGHFDIMPNCAKLL
jgi:hypothetical protein